MRIVIVEDELRIKEGLNNLIKKLYPDHTVVAMEENGQEGLEAIREHRPDLVFTDIRMPVMSGLDMLEQINEDQIPVKAVILSAYSEFEYAQKAMRLGVKDYLIKPVVVSEFMRIMKNMEEETEREKEESMVDISDVSDVLSLLLYGSLEYDDKIRGYLSNRFQIKEDTPMMLLNCYLGYHYQDGMVQTKKDLRFWLGQKSVKYELLELEKEKCVLAVLYQYDDFGELERWFQNNILLDKREKNRYVLCFGTALAAHAGELRHMYQYLIQNMDWNIVLGKHVLISYPKVKQIQTVFCVYPSEIEKNMKASLCASDYDMVETGWQNFLSYFHDRKVYLPKEVKECFVRFLWSMMGVIKEIQSDILEEINQQKMLEEIMSAICMSELEVVGAELIERCRAYSKDQRLSLSIKRTINQVQEYYHTGITLEEIAKNLNLSSEYLSGQFRKELGVNFSTYIRDYRIAKAKELLLRTELKQYEVAEKVGYSDPKYFG